MAHMPRTDAVQNRRRILAAARSLLSTRSLDVTMRDVARAAAVGPATLYRHFPTKRDLIEAVFAENVRECERIVEEGRADPDPVRGFTRAVTGLVVDASAIVAIVPSVTAPMPATGRSSASAGKANAARSSRRRWFRSTSPSRICMTIMPFPPCLPSSPARRR